MSSEKIKILKDRRQVKEYLLENKKLTDKTISRYLGIMGRILVTPLSEIREHPSLPRRVVELYEEYVDNFNSGCIQMLQLKQMKDNLKK